MSGYTGRDPRSGRLVTVTVEDDVVRHVRTRDDDGAAHPWIAPGLVDLQVNGFGGHDVNGPGVTADDVVALTAALARAGTTTFVPTVVTASEEDIDRSLRAVVEARRRDPAVRHAIPFVHLEGPHISEEDGPRGAHPLDQVRPPDVAELDRWQATADGLVGIVTISPHHPGSVEYTEAATATGVVVAVGHTHAGPEQIRAVVDAGATLSTHLGNGAHAVLARHPNYIWAQLAEDRLTAGFIADGHHLPGDTLTAMLRAKGLDRSVLVSDSVALAGLPAGSYETPVGGHVELSDDGRLNVAGTPYLAGAARSLADGVAEVCRLAGLSLADALRLATTNPSRLVPGRGRLVPGAPADLVLFDHSPGDRSLTLRQVVAGGARGGVSARGPVRAGVAVRDVTPGPGCLMSGFVARTSPATGAHDTLLVQALVVEDTAVVTVDVVGLHEEDCGTVRRRCPLPDDRVVVHATHTHGGPVSMRGRLGSPRDEGWWQRVLDACVNAVTEAVEKQEPAIVRAGYAEAPGIARNRRRPDGPVDDAVPVVRLERDDGSVLATVVSYACHPVVLGADNTLLTADYPGVVRRRLSEATGGAHAVPHRLRR
ncbi:amidohydrolase family protein [Georgenia sp. SUBG003]|uniref:amidohydrolase family protein n=1 Tax=Georgenia sp. SUBG003 TaxID=1497974 RepID=UPI000B0570AE